MRRFQLLGLGFVLFLGVLASAAEAQSGQGVPTISPMQEKFGPQVCERLQKAMESYPPERGTGPAPAEVAHPEPVPLPYRQIIHKAFDLVLQGCIGNCQAYGQKWAEILANKATPQNYQQNKTQIERTEAQARSQLNAVMALALLSCRDKTTPEAQPKPKGNVEYKCRPYDWGWTECKKLAPADINEVWVAPKSGCLHVKEGALFTGGAAGGAACWFRWTAPRSGTLSVTMHSHLQGRQGVVCAGWWANAGTWAATFVKIVDADTNESAQQINWSHPGSLVCHTSTRDFRCPSHSEVTTTMKVTQGRTYLIGGGLVAGATSAGVGSAGSNFYMRICWFKLSL